MESKIDVLETENLELAKAFAVEELEERLEFGTWTLSAEASSNGTGSMKMAWSNK